MMHCDQGADVTESSAFYANLESYGVPFDVIGLSYYPVLSEPSISGLKTNVDGLATEFRKPIVIAELSILATARRLAVRQHLPEPRRGLRTRSPRLRPRAVGG
jgi:arabinogalactan endo-1,4-beta-galactosidase